MKFSIYFSFEIKIITSYISAFIVLIDHQLVRWTEGVQLPSSVKRKRQ